MNDSYLEYVKKEAYKLGYLFMLDSGEGRECKSNYKNWYVEDLSGWLISENQRKDFLKARENGNLDKFDNYYVLVRWFLNDGNDLHIRFSRF